MRCELADRTRERAMLTAFFHKNGNGSTRTIISAKENNFLLKPTLAAAATTMTLFILLLAIAKGQLSFVLVNEFRTIKEKDLSMMASRDISVGSCLGGHSMRTPNNNRATSLFMEGDGDRYTTNGEIHSWSRSRSSSAGGLNSIFPVTFGLAQTVTGTSAAPNTTAPATTTRAATADDATQPLYWWVILVAALVSFPILLLSCYFLLMWQQKTLHEYKGKYEEMLKALGENTRRVQDQVSAAKKKRRNEALSGGNGDTFSGNTHKNGEVDDDGDETTDKRRGDGTFSLSITRDKAAHPQSSSRGGPNNNNNTNNKSNNNASSSGSAPQVEMKALDLTFGGKYNDLLDDEFYSLSSFQQRRKGGGGGETNASNPQNRRREGGGEGIGAGAVPIGAGKAGERGGGGAVNLGGATTGRGAVIVGGGGGGGEEDEAYILAEQRRNEIREGLLHHGRLELQHQIMGMSRIGGGGGGVVTARPPPLLLNTLPSRNSMMNSMMIVSGPLLAGGDGVGGRAGVYHDGDGVRSLSASGALAKSSGSFVRSSQPAYVPPSRVAAIGHARKREGEGGDGVGVIDDMDLLPSSPSPLVVSSRRIPATNAGGVAAVRTSASASAYDPLSLESIAADTAAAHRTLQELKKTGPLRHLESLI